MNSTFRLSLKYLALFSFTNLGLYFLIATLVLNQVEEELSLFLAILGTFFISQALSFLLLNWFRVRLYHPLPQSRAEYNFEPFEEMDRASEMIEEKFTHLEGKTLAEIQNNAREMVALSRKINGQIQLQKRNILLLSREVATQKEKAESERNRAQQAKLLARDLRNLKEEQLKAIAFVLTQEARKETRKFFWLGVAVTSALAFLSWFIQSPVSFETITDFFLGPFD